MAEYHGYVIEVCSDTFWAAVDVCGFAQDWEIFKALLPESELPLLQPGALFVARNSGDGLKIEFNRETWTAEELAEAERRAEELRAAIR